MEMKEMKKYYLGLDIGTDSIGYAVTDENYALLKYKGEPMWGVHILEEAQLAAKRRSFRTARRRLDRRQQRVLLLQELFAHEIAKVDPKFFIRIQESRLWSEDASVPIGLFHDPDYRDRDYHREYPTIHHLICALMNGTARQDVRLVYLACAWLVAHRGHFLSEVSKDNISDLLDFSSVYGQLMAYLNEHSEEETAWVCEDPAALAEILKQQKYKAVTALLYGKKKPESAPTAGFPYSREGILTLLCGDSYSVEKLFGKEEYAEQKSVSLSMKDEDFDMILHALGDDSELLARLKLVYDWFILHEILNGKTCISEAKVAVYEQHQHDLRGLKCFVRKYLPEKYNEIFRTVKKDRANYCAYSGNVKSDRAHKAELKRVSQEDFCKYIKALVKNVKPDAEDQDFYVDMCARLDANRFLPKQTDGDNRIIPYQLYWVELKQILQQASAFLPFLNETDADGYVTSDKILSIFTFRVPYYVGPLNFASNGWVKRKAGKITPWNFDEMVDEDASEQAFIARMTNTCTYLAGEPVLAKSSLVYERFQVLNEINNLTLNDRKITVAEKQALFQELFAKRKRVTRKNISDYFVQNGLAEKGKVVLGGIDETIKSSLNSAYAFRSLLISGALTEADVEEIISRSTFTESRARFAHWIDARFPQLSEAERRHLSSLKFRDFGRLSNKLLCELEGVNNDTREVLTIMQALWSTNCNFMELLSERFTFAEQIAAHNQQYYAAHPTANLSERLDDMYISNAVKRPIIRTLDIVSDVVKAEGHAPEKIFVEMARGGDPKEKGKRTRSRYEQLTELYKKINTEDARRLQAELDAMGEAKDSRLQSEKLFLYYLQLGRCMYTGTPIELDKLMNQKLYDIDHIWPRAKVKDDSILNNKVLVLSTVNNAKGDRYPIDADIRHKMGPTWKIMLEHGLITKEKYDRLTRSKPFDENEEWNFINRQMVETRQSTKAVAELLQEKYPQSEIVYVKAGLVSDFRHKNNLLKSRKVNDLHHAKDAYLNIVAGNVYHERFTRKWFLENRNNYSIKTEILFGRQWKNGEQVFWNGEESLELVKKTMQKNAVHFTQYAVCKKHGKNGGLFDQQPLKAAPGLVPLKKGLATEKYGGYNKPTASFFILVKYPVAKKQEIMVMSVDLMIKDQFLSDAEFAKEYAMQQIGIVTGKTPANVTFPLGMRILKINTMFSFDGYRMCLSCKSSGGSKVQLSTMMPLTVGQQWEHYIKKMESLLEKKEKNSNMVYSPDFDKVSKEENEQLYLLLSDKLQNTIYQKRPTNPAMTLVNGIERFKTLDIFEQSKCLMQIIGVFGRTNNGFDLRSIDGKEQAGVSTLSSKISNWKKYYTDVRIIDQSASGLYEKQSCNLLELL